MPTPGTDRQTCELADGRRRERVLIGRLVLVLGGRPGQLTLQLLVLLLLLSLLLLDIHIIICQLQVGLA